MPKVFVVQQQEGKNILPAKKYGTLTLLLPSDLNLHLGVEETINDLKKKLAGFSSEDYILPIGDPVAIGLVFAVALQINSGFCKVCKWDRQEREYYEVIVRL